MVNKTTPVTAAYFVLCQHYFKILSIDFQNNKLNSLQVMTYSILANVSKM